MKRVISAMLFCLFCAALALGVEDPSTAVTAKEAPQFSVGYLYQGSQPTFGGGSFGLNGGRADMMLPVTRHLELVAEFSGVHADNIPLSATGLTMLTYMAGPRLSLPVHSGREAGKLVPFAQVLFGGVHATEGAFPSGSSLSSTANAFAMSAGGGLQVSLNQHFSVRLVQAEYLYTRLPNSVDNYQNSYRIGAGVAYRLR
jgi:opacity protein-like surface antigen